MTKVAFFETVTSIFEIVGVAAMVLGFVVAIVLGIRSLVVTRDGRVAFKTLRDSIGLVILLGLEILVAADLVRTVTSTPSLTDDAVFISELSIALYVLPVVFGGIGVNLISHVRLRHLSEAEKRFDREHPDE